MEQRILANMPIDEYHKRPELSCSQLKKILDCPYLFHQDQLTLAAKVETPSLIRGAAFHTYFLEPDLFNDQYVVVDEIDKRTKKYKELKSEIEISGKKLITYSDFENIKKMVLNLCKIPISKKIFKDGLAEQSFFWTDKDTGQKLRCRPDYLIDNYIIDIKTTRSSDPRLFTNDIVKYKYNMQAAMYLDGVEDVTGVKDRKFVFIACEKEPTFICEWYILGLEEIEIGRALYKTAIKLYQECEKNNKWPTYCSTKSDHEILFSEWQMKELKNLIEKWS